MWSFLNNNKKIIKLVVEFFTKFSPLISDNLKTNKMRSKIENPVKSKPYDQIPEKEVIGNARAQPKKKKNYG